MVKGKRGKRGAGDAKMWKLRSCPKCRGDLFIDSDSHGFFEQCLQCGYIQDLKTTVGFKELASERKRELAVAGHHKKSVAN